jgi:putative membrane protein
MLAFKRVGPAVLVAAVGLAVASAAPAAGATQPTPTPSATDTGTGTPTPTPSATGTGTATASPSTTQTAEDTQFLQLMHQANLAEVQAGNLAKQRGKNGTVKDLGQMFVTDHTQLDQSVQQAASTAGVTLPNAPTADQQRAIDRLKGTSGSEFDRLWVTTELGWHVQSLALIDAELSGGSDQAVVQVAQRAQPTIQQHLDELRALAQNMGIPVPTPSATPSGTGSATPSTPSTPGGTSTTETPSPTGS